MQPSQGKSHAERSEDVAIADAVPADGAPSASQRQAVPAKLSARKLAGLPLLGHRTRAVSFTPLEFVMTSRLQHFRSSLGMAALVTLWISGAAAQPAPTPAGPPAHEPGGAHSRARRRGRHGRGRLIRNGSRIWSLPAAFLRITTCSTAGATCRSDTTAIPTA